MATETRFITPSDLIPFAVGILVVGVTYSVAVTIVLLRTIMENFITITVLMAVLSAVIYLLWKALPFLVTRGQKMVGTNSSRIAGPPPGIKQLNKSVWQLYSPEGTPEMEIIFFHDLQLGDFRDAYWKTWVARDNSEVVWPKDWLSKKFPTARILSVSYNTSAILSDECDDLNMLGEILVDNIIMDRECGIGQGSHIFFVGHGFGGIAIKQLVLQAFMRSSLHRGSEISKQIDNFIGNIRGVFYYGTPHEGTWIANVAHFIPGISPLVGLLQALEKHTARLNEEFNRVHLSLGIQTSSMVETQPIPIFKLPFSNWTFGVKVVQEASSRQDSDSYFAAASNHLTVCKPTSERDPRFARLVSFIDDLIKNSCHPKSVATSDPSNLQ